jgi:pescadillo protein
VDALRDLDDPLTMVHLFAVLPAEAAHGIPAAAVAMSRRLSLEWQAWVVRTSALRRTFVSVKGFYFQAEVMGQPVTWLVPHALSQVGPALIPSGWLTSPLKNRLHKCTTHIAAIGCQMKP